MSEWARIPGGRTHARSMHKPLFFPIPGDDKEGEQGRGNQPTTGKTVREARSRTRSHTPARGSGGHRQWWRGDSNGW
jgi:hypothetical protein